MAASVKARPQILIVPEQHSHDMERALCAIGGNSVSLGAEVLSFTRLASRVFSVCGGLAAPALDGGGRLLLLRMALGSVVDQLKVYQRPSRKPAFLSGLLATVDELKTCRITPEQLWNAGTESGGEEGEKLADLSLIYGAYEALTARQGADPRDRLTRLAEALRRTGWVEGKDFYLDGFTDLTPQERQVVAALIDKCNSFTVALTCDKLEEDQGGAGIFSPARRTARQLLRLAKGQGVPAQVEVRPLPAEVRSPALAHLERELFAPQPVPYPEEPESLSLFTALSPYSEVEWTAAEILRLVREEGYRFRDIAVCARGMEEYGSLIQTVFARYGVPVFLSRMSDILEKPILALITAALDTAAGGYRYDDIFRYLKTGLTDLSQEDVDLLENYALTWSLEGSAWTGKKPWTNHPKGYGHTFTQEDKDLVERLEGLRRQVVGPLEALRKNPDKTGAGQAKALYKLLEDIGGARAAGSAGQGPERGRPAGPGGGVRPAVGDILCEGLEQCAQILGESPMELEEFARLFALVLSQYDVGSIPVSLDQVTCGEMPRLAHKKYRAVFLLGADDGAIPAAAPSPGLLNDDDRSLLASYGLELAPQLGDKLYREMTIVYECCAMARERFSVSWAAAGPDGAERRPSFLAEKLKLIFPKLDRVEEGRLDGTFRLAAPRPALELAGRWSWAGAALERLPDYAPLVERMRRAASLDRGRLHRQAVDALYGSRVPMSASRMDKYKACHFSYFMQYGLKAEPRRAAGFQAPEYGTFVHYVLEHVLLWCKEKGGVKEVSPEELHTLCDQAVEHYVSEELGGLEGENARFRYLFRRLKKSVYAVVDNVAEELRASQFQPISFELGFGRNQDLPPVELTVDGVTVSISGFVDRVDGWVHDGRLYLRVVDYKTGRKSFDLTEIWNGMGLQMLLYLFTLEKQGKELYNMDVTGAGVLYLPARDAVAAGSRAMSDQQRQKLVDSQLRRKGILLDDPDVLTAMEDPAERGIRFLPVRVTRTGAISGEALVSAQRLGRLAKHTQKVLEDIGKELAAGNINADPFWRGAGPQRLPVVRIRRRLPL